MRKCRCATADGVVLVGNNVVLVRRGREPEKGKLALPGGFVEMNETFEQACKREVKEETGLDMRVYRRIGVFDSPEREERGCVSVAFLGFAEGLPEAGDDAADVVLIPVHEAIELAKKRELAFDHSDILLNALSNKGIDIAVKAFVFRDGKVLAIKQTVFGKEVWDLPGGRIAHGESPEEALKMEVMEETGIKISDVMLRGWTQFFRFDGSQTICMVFSALFESQTEYSNPDEEENITHMSWMEPDEFLSIDDNREFMQRLKHILKQIKALK